MMIKNDDEGTVFCIDENLKEKTLFQLGLEVCEDAFYYKSKIYFKAE